MAQKIVFLALIMFIMAIVGCVSAQDGAKTAPATSGGKKGGSAEAAPPTKSAVAGLVPVEGADPAGLSPADSGDAADGPIGETPSADPGVVPLGPTSSVVADGPAGAGGKSGAAVLKVPLVASVASGFLFLFCSSSFF